MDAIKTMKQILISMLLFVFSLNCDGSSRSHSNAEYKLKPGDLKVSVDPTTIEGFDITYNGINYSRQNAYAVICKQKINGIDYIGISACEDGSPFNGQGINLKIVFQSPEIPSEVTLQKDVTPGFGIRLTINENKYDLAGNDASITITISGPDANNVYTIQGKSGNDTISVGNADLTISQIRARYVSQ